MPETESFRINYAVLANRIEEIKRNPPPEILAYWQLHPEFKTVACELLAAYAKVSLSTLKNLKQGKLTDANCSTIYLICKALNLDPADIFGLPRGKLCDPSTCGNQSKERIDELVARYDDADKRLVNLRTIIRDQSIELGSARAKVEALELMAKEKDAALLRRDHGIKVRNHIIFVLIGILVALFIADLLVSSAGWFRFAVK